MKRDNTLPGLDGYAKPTISAKAILGNAQDKRSGLSQNAPNAREVEMRPTISAKAILGDAQDKRSGLSQNARLAKGIPV